MIRRGRPEHTFYKYIQKMRDMNINVRMPAISCPLLSRQSCKESRGSRFCGESVALESIPSELPGIRSK